MAAKEITLANQAQEKLKRGIDKLANAVRITLGPKGRNVVLEKKFGAPQVTKDGVTVAKESASKRNRSAMTTTKSNRWPASPPITTTRLANSSLMR